LLTGLYDIQRQREPYGLQITGRKQFSQQTRNDKWLQSAGRTTRRTVQQRTNRHASKTQKKPTINDENAAEFANSVASLTMPSQILSPGDLSQGMLGERDLVATIKLLQSKVAQQHEELRLLHGMYVR
jgi:hypothetical protein